MQYLYILERELDKQGGVIMYGKPISLLGGS